MELEHYLEQLSRKPGALRHCRATQAICKQLEILLDRLDQRLGYIQANREFIQILMLSRRYSLEQLERAISMSLEYGALAASAIETLLRSMSTLPSDPVSDQWLTQELPHVAAGAFHPECDLSDYAQLAKVGDLC